MHKIAVIIPHYNDVDRLERCLGALVPQLAEDVEVIVVDNGSTEPLEAIMRDFAGIRFVTENAKGAAPARNRGVSETSAQYIAFLDADCVPAENWLAHARSRLGQADMIGGDVEIFHETAPPLNGAQAFEQVFAFDIKSYIEAKHFTVTANLVTSREIFEAVGPFRAGVSEDLDWCIRARDLGYRLVYDPHLKVAHPSRNDWPALRKKWVRMTEEGFGLVPDSSLARGKWALRAFAMLPSILAHAPRVINCPQLPDRRTKLAALATLTRLRLLRCRWMLQQSAGATIS